MQLSPLRNYLRLLSHPAQVPDEQESRLALAEYRASVIRLSALLYLAATLIALAVTYLPDMRDQVRLIPATSLILMGVTAAIIVYTYPWSRHHPTWFLTIGVVASVHIGVFIWATGGSA